MVQCVAHRGWSSRAPENTLAAFELAIREANIHAIELDVHLSKDGIPVVIHDHTINRTTNGTGRVIEYTAEELRQFDAGAWFGPVFTDEKIPLLEEVMQLAKGKKPLVLELKQQGNLYDELERKVVQLIEQYSMEFEVTVTSFDHVSVNKIKTYNPAIETGLIFSGRPTLLEEQIKHTRASHMAIQYSFVTKELIKTVKQSGAHLGVWTVDDVSEINRMMELSRDIRITTNYPEKLMALFMQREKH